MKLKDRVAVVTGGVSGIGRATVLEMAREGAAVVVNYSKSEDDAKVTAQQLKEIGAQCLLVKADVSEEAEVKAMLDETIATFGRVDVLVNNAGATAFAPFFDLDVPTWDRVLAVCLRGPYLCMKYFGKIMIEQGSGAIVNVTSSAAYVPEGSCAAYFAAKAGLVQLTRAAATAMAPAVRVNSVAPGFIATPWYPKYGIDLERRTEQAVTKIPLKRAGQSEDLAPAIVFLSSDGASFITGQSLIVDGGRFMQ